MNAAENTSFIYRARARLRNAPARSGQRAIRRAFLQSLARIRETRQRGAGNARFAAAFFNLSRDSQRLSSIPRAAPRNAPARSGQRANRGAFLLPLARVRETRQWSTSNSSSVSVSTPRARPRDAPARSGQHAIRGGFHSAPRSRPRDAPVRSGQRANRGAFFQPLARIREARQRGVGNARIAAAFL